MDGVITEIQRFCLKDGPGIRTTVFFKGCNMRCSWCHNPEAMKASPDLLFYYPKCISCGKCFEVCLNNAHELTDGRHVINRLKCSRCGRCAGVCYAGALIMSAKTVSVDDVMKEVLQDKPYYIDSGGGVTLSGGEALCQKAFVLAIAEACHDNGIHIAIETNLHHQFDDIVSVLQKLDTLMIDIKLMDNAMHEKWTGVDNKLILSNIQKVDGLGIPFIVRTPLIPGVTDTCENLKATAAFLKPLKNCMYYELLNYNPLGASKYANMGLDYAFARERPFSRQHLARIRDLVSECGITVKIS